MEDRKLSEKESLDIITLIGRDILFDSVYAKLYLVLGMDAHVCCRTGYFI